MCYQTYPGVCVYNILVILQPNQIMLISAFTVQDCHFLWDFTWNLMNYWLCDVTKDWHDWLFWPSFLICKSEEQLYLPLYLLGGLDEIFYKVSVYCWTVRKHSTNIHFNIINLFYQSGKHKIYPIFEDSEGNSHLSVFSICHALISLSPEN